MLAAAGCLTFLVGLVHSVLGEKLIFSRMREPGGIIPTKGEPLLRERHVRILWASWHVVTALGWGFGAILLKMPQKLALIAAMLASSALVLVGTQGKHPGWIGLLGVAVLVWLA